MIGKKLARSLSLVWFIVAVVIVSGLLLGVTGCSAEPEPSDYMSWTKSDWDKATDQQKLDATKAVLSDLQKDMAETMGVDAPTEEELDATAAAMIDQVDLFFDDNSDATLQDLADQTKSLLGV